jgi:class 3 adenylate cyclase
MSDSSTTSPLAQIESHLRTLLPADLYAAAWIDPSAATLTRVFEHLRTLHRILQDYTPQQVSAELPRPGHVRYAWKESTLMFTDLAGFTPLMEASAAHGPTGAETLLNILNAYFAEILEIISKSGGNLLEFTGDATLVEFPADKRRHDTAQAARAGLRMQRAMARFDKIETAQGVFSLKMRIGIHKGRFLTGDIGTPQRMEHVLLGRTVLQTKRTEGAGATNRVCLSDATHKHIPDEFRFEPGAPGHYLVVDDLTAEQLGEYEVHGTYRRSGRQILLDRTPEGILNEIVALLAQVEPLASYLPMPILNLLVENAARRRIQPDFAQPTVVFVNLIGLAEVVDDLNPGEEEGLIAHFAQALALINAAVESRGGVLKKVTYHTAGSDIVIFFGVPNAHTDDPIRAASAALAIRDVIAHLPPPIIRGRTGELSCQIGIAHGSVFAAEIGDPAGRREFNILGDTVNTAARLMGRAVGNRILMTDSVYQLIAPRFKCDPLGAMPLKGKTALVPIFALRERLTD